MENGVRQTYEIIEVCLLAGRIMLESGAETNRVEDTMNRIASSFGIHHAHSYATPTGLFFSADGTDPAKFMRISERSTDLHKVAMVNSISRSISAGELTVQEALQDLKEVNSSVPTFKMYVQIAAAAMTSGCFLIMFNGNWNDFIPAMIAGGLGFSCSIYLHNLIQIKFFAEFFAAFVIGLSAYFFVTVGVGHDIDKIIIGSVMPLVPGVLITNAVRDLIAGHLVSGLSRGAEAFLTSCAIGTGIAIVFSFL